MYELKIEEPIAYKERKNRNYRFNLIIGFCFCLLVGILSKWIYAIFMSVFFIVVQNFKSDRWDKFFILNINIDNENLHLIYKKEDERIELEGLLSDFKFKKETAFSKVRTVYLAVYFKDRLLLKQFRIGDWNENKIDEFLDDYKTYALASIDLFDNKKRQ